MDGKKDMLPSPKLGVRSLTLGCSCHGSVSQAVPVQEACTSLVSCGTQRERTGSLCLTTGLLSRCAFNIAHKWNKFSLVPNVRYQGEAFS